MQSAVYSRTIMLCVREDIPSKSLSVDISSAVGEDVVGVDRCRKEITDMLFL